MIAMPAPTTDFGPMIRDLRKKQGLTLAKLAQRVGMSVVDVAAIESGVPTYCCMGTVMAFARALSVHAADILGSKPELPTPAKEFAQLFDASPPDVQRAIMQILKSRRPDPPPRPAVALRDPAQFEVPFFPLDHRHQIRAWAPRRVVGGE